jgi:two-component system response regulator HydG
MKPKILIVDDEPAHCRMLEAVLKAEKYETHRAEDGQSAIEAVTARFYDLILMDIRMNRVGGIEALQKIK